MIAMPITPVRRPPTLKLIRLGQRLEKSLAGETTFAATLVVSVAMRRASIEVTVIQGVLNLARSTTGSQIGSPKTTSEADVTATPMNAYRVIVVGRPRVWPRICAFWFL